MTTQKNRLVLIDGSAYLYRAFYALPELRNAQGLPTNAIYGVINMIQRLRTHYAPTHMAIIFDAPGKTFRDELYPAYKTTRRETPKELIQQIEPLHAVIQALGLPMVMINGVEADDVIGTLAKQAEKQEYEIIIATGDKDCAQLVSSAITLIDTMTDTCLDIAGVQKKFGVLPQQMIDYLALVGDTADNIPGIPGVGPRTASKWLATYGSLEKTIAQADDISGKVGSNLRAGLSQLALSKQLVTICCTVPLTINVDALQVQPIHYDRLIELYTTLNFKRLLHHLTAQLTTSNKPPTTPPQGQAMAFQKDPRYALYETITTKSHFMTWIKQLAQSDCFAFDTETTSLDEMQAKLVGVSFAIHEGQAAYLPLAHDYPDAPQQLSQSFALKHLKGILENPAIQKMGQNIKYDMKILARYGIHLRGIRYDTMLESYVLNSQDGRRDLDTLALKHLNWKTIKFHDVAGKGNKQLTFNSVPVEQATLYAAEDADVTLRIHHALWPTLEKELTLKHLFDTIEMPLIGVLARMEQNGVCIDPQQLEEENQALLSELNELEKEIFSHTQHSFNLNSPKQLQHVLFNELKLPQSRKTTTGQASTRDAVLQMLSHDFEVPRLIIAYRAAAKLQSTYTHRLIEQINPATGRLHTSYHQAGTATGRLSSSHPNLQNIPIRTKEGRRIRQAFIAPPGYQLICADYSQIELRLMAHLSSDSALLSAFLENQDIHRATAAEVWGVSLEQVSPEMRRHAKAINFGLIYGMSAFGLAQQLGISRHEAQYYIDGYFSRYPGVKAYMEESKARAVECGYVETLCGRRLYLPDIHSRYDARRKAAERAAINAPLQGSAADMMKLVMIEFDQWLNTHAVDAKMILQVHDELVFEVAEPLVESIQTTIHHYMTSVLSLRVPLLVSIGVGRNWDAASAH